MAISALQLAVETGGLAAGVLPPALQPAHRGRTQRVLKKRGLQLRREMVWGDVVGSGKGGKFASPQHSVDRNKFKHILIFRNSHHALSLPIPLQLLDREGKGEGERIGDKLWQRGPAL